MSSIKSKSRRPGLEDKRRLQDKEEEGREKVRNKTNNNLLYNPDHVINLTQEDLLKLQIITRISRVLNTFSHDVGMV